MWRKRKWEEVEYSEGESGKVKCGEKEREESGI